MPTHDRPQLLARALGSVLGQTASPSEVVVVDDLSQDSARHVVEQCALGSAVEVHYIAAKGLAAGTAGSSRNVGANRATGELLAFLDDDDEWAPAFLEQVVGRMGGHNAQIGLCHIEYRKGAHSVLGMAMQEGLSANDCLYNPGMTGSNLVVCHEGFDRIGGFDPDLTVANDIDALVRLLDSGLTYTVVPQALVTRHSHDLGHLTGKGERRALGLVRYYDRYRHRMTLDQRRMMLRSIHSARRGREHRLHQRMYHAAAQVAFSSPRQFVDMYRLRSRRLGRLFN